jgi:PKD domain
VEGVCEEGSTTNCDFSKDADLVEPYHWYMHRDVTYSSFYQGGCITAGVFVPEGIWPSKYRYLFADFTFKEVYNLMKRSRFECRECIPPLPGTKNVTFYQSPTTNKYYKDLNGGRMTDLFFGPFGDTQALYLVQGGDDTVLRIRYTGSKNAPPLVNFSVPEEGVLKAGESIQFASATTDEDGDDLAFKWDFGDGSESDKENPEHVYNQTGQFRVTLTVTDAANQTQQNSQTVVVGQKPDATMLSPTFGEHFQVGQHLTLLGDAVDSEGAKIPDSQIEWEVRQHHAGMSTRTLQIR